jgi:hypothetical protein
MGLALLVAPGLLSAAYEGRGLPVLNRVLAATSRKPLEHYQGLWRSFAVAALLTLALHGALVTRIRRLFPERGWRLGLAAIAGGFLLVTLVAGPRHDYPAYLEIWKVALEGNDPWWIHPKWGYPLNAYGPLFLALAPLSALNELAPKLLFATVFLVLGLAILASFRRDARLQGRPIFVLMALSFLNPYFWSEIACYGHFDILVAFCCVVAVLCRLMSGRRDGAAGVALGLGILLKYLPVVLLPFLVLSIGVTAAGGRRLEVRTRLLASALTTVAAGFLAATWKWGSAPLTALEFASTRGSAGMSIFRFLRGRYSPLEGLADPSKIDAMALPVLAVAGLAVFGWCLWRRLDVPTSAAAGALVTLLFYRVGFPQYQVIVFALLALSWRYDPPRWARSRSLQASAIAYVLWVGLAISFDVAAGGTVGDRLPWAWLEDALGLPTFVLGCWLLGSLLSATNLAQGAQALPSRSA